MASKLQPTDAVRRRKQQPFKEQDDRDVRIVSIPPPKNHEDNEVNEPIAMSKHALLSVLIVYFSVFLDFMGISIIQPILPFFAKTFNATPTELGALYSSYSAMSFFASMFMGRAADKFGRKPMIIFSLFGTCIGFLLCGFAQSYGQLLAFRFVTGFFGATAPVAMAVVTDLVPSASRAKYLAAQGAIISLAFVVGPGLGSGLGQFGIRVPFFVSSGLGLFGMLFAIVFLRESHPVILKQRRVLASSKDKTHASDNAEAEQDTTSAELEAMNSVTEQNDELKEMDDIKIVHDETAASTVNATAVDATVPAQVYVLCVVYILCMLGFTVYQSMFALYVIELYGLNSLEVGYITLVLASLVILGNFIFVNGAKYIGNCKQLCIGASIFAVALLVAPFVDNLWGLLVTVVLGFGVGYGHIPPGVSVSHATMTNFRNRATIMGYSSMARDLSLIVGPMLMGFLYSMDKRYPFYAGAASVGLGVLVLIGMMWHWPYLRETDQQHITSDDDEVTEMDEANWKYIAEKPKKGDYMKLGKALGVMLIEKRYRWVSHLDRHLQFLDTVYPVLSIDSLQQRHQNIQFLRTGILSLRSEWEHMQYNAAAAVKL